MGYGDPYQGMVERVLRAVRTNYLRISVSSGFQNTVTAVFEADGEAIAQTFPLLVILDDQEDWEYRVSHEAEATLIYTVEGSFSSEAPGTLRPGVRSLFEDVVKAHHSDLSLAAADLQNGGSGAQLMKEHRIVGVQRFYSRPVGKFRARISGRISFGIFA